MPKGGFDHPQEALEQGWNQPDPGPPKCVFNLNELGDAGCPHMKCTYEGMDGERYRCRNCGLSYFLDYEEMK